MKAHRIIVRQVRITDPQIGRREYPIVFAGTPLQCYLWANQLKLRWVPDQTVFGGYWANEQGESYLPE